MNLIYIVVGIAISLLGLLFAFLQWFYPRHVGKDDHSTSSLHHSELISFTGQVPLPPTQTVPLGMIETSPTTDAKITQQLEQPIKEIGSIEPIRHILHYEDWGEKPHISQFYGRERELAELEQWIVSDRCRLAAVLGIGGIGKTALTAKLVEQIEGEFEYIFWRSLQNAPPIENMLKNCTQFLSDQQQIDLPEGLDSQIILLMQYLRDHRCLLVLDNMETILLAGSTAGQYREGYESYGRLIQRLAEGKHQSCLLLTSREKPKEVANFEGKTSPVRSLHLSGIGHSEGQEILRDKGLFGSDEAWSTLIHLYSGNPLALKLVSEPVRELFGGDVAGFLKRGEVLVGDVYDLLRKQFQRLSELERELMYWLAIEREAVSLNESGRGYCVFCRKNRFVRSSEIIEKTISN